MENHLNDLDGSQWLYWTNSLYETNFPPDRTHRYRKLHGAIKPPELMAEIVAFFTKKGELILDPFAGVGSTLLGAELIGRRAVGIELNPAWVQVYQEIGNSFSIVNGRLTPKLTDLNLGGEIQSCIVLGDCLEEIKKYDSASFAAIITDPPYGCQHGPSGFKNETNFNMKNNNEFRDFGNSATFEEYLYRMREFGKEAFRLLRPGRYLVLLIGDRYCQGEYLPLGTRVAEVMRGVGFKWKGLRIWWNKATQRPLKPYAVKSCFVPNINHQNLLILRKEKS